MRLGQLLMVGVEGAELTPELELFLKETGVGGVVLFGLGGASPGKIAQFIKAMKDVAGDALIVAVDQEGGRVARLPPPFTRLPPMAALGKAASKDAGPASPRDAKLAWRAGALVGRELAAIGVDLDFAPVLDISTNAFNPVIGDRAFSSDASQVARLGVEFIRGLEEHGVASCGKHFPGHGDTDWDSHLILPMMHHTMKRLEVCELIPFKAAIEAGVPAIMVAHLMLTNIDKEFPATISRKVITGILRREMGFDGLVIADDLSMKGIAAVHPPHESAWRAIAAGADMALVCERDLDLKRRVLQGLRRFADEDPTGEAWLSASLDRVARFKERCCLSEKDRPPLDVIGCRGHRKLVNEIEKLARY